MSITFTNRGIDILITKLMNQFKKVPIDTALSYIISAMYNQTIGPDENSKKHINSNTQVTIPIVFLSKA